jgi:hypothetical protein
VGRLDTPRAVRLEHQHAARQPASIELMFTAVRTASRAVHPHGRQHGPRHRAAFH